MIGSDHILLIYDNYDRIDCLTNEFFPDQRGFDMNLGKREKPLYKSLAKNEKNPYINRYP